MNQRTIYQVHYNGNKANTINQLCSATHNNVATFWLAPGYRQFEAYEATVDFQNKTDSQSFIAEEEHIIKDDETFYCNPTNLWTNKSQHDQPRHVNMDLTQEMVNLQQHWVIRLLNPAQDEEGISDEGLLLRYHRQFFTHII